MPLVKFPISFAYLCRVHAGLDVLAGAAILFNWNAIADKSPQNKTAKVLFSEKSDDRVAVRASESLVGLLLVDVGLLLGLLSYTESAQLKTLTCRTAVGIHGLMIGWRLWFQHQIIPVNANFGKQILGDMAMAATWILYLVNEP